jgi:hypothetical protein
MQDVLGKEIRVNDIIVYGLRKGDSGALSLAIVMKVDDEKGKITALTNDYYVERSSVFNEPKRACVVGHASSSDVQVLTEQLAKSSAANAAYGKSWDGKSHSTELMNEYFAERKKYKDLFEEIVGRVTNESSIR